MCEQNTISNQSHNNRLITIMECQPRSKRNWERNPNAMDEKYNEDDMVHIVNCSKPKGKAGYTVNVLINIWCKTEMFQKGKKLNTPCPLKFFDKLLQGTQRAEFTHVNTHHKQLLHFKCFQDVHSWLILMSTLFKSFSQSRGFSEKEQDIEHNSGNTDKFSGFSFVSGLAHKHTIQYENTVKPLIAKEGSTDCEAWKKESVTRLKSNNHCGNQA